MSYESCIQTGQSYGRALYSSQVHLMMDDGRDKEVGHDTTIYLAVFLLLQGQLRMILLFPSGNTKKAALSGSSLAARRRAAGIPR